MQRTQEKKRVIHTELDCWRFLVVSSKLLEMEVWHSEDKLGSFIPEPFLEYQCALVTALSIRQNKHCEPDHTSESLTLSVRKVDYHSLNSK